MICRGGGVGGFVGRAPGQQQQQQQETEPPIQLRLFTLTTHLVLQCFNPLDDLSRKHVFEAMGWSRDNYLKRQQALRVQVENAKKAREQMRQKKKEEEEKAKQEREEADDGETNKEACEEGETTKNEDEGEHDAEKDSSDAPEQVQELTSEEATLDEGEGANDDGKGAASTNDKVENGESQEDAELNCNDDTTANTDTQGEDETTQEEKPEVDDNDNPDLLPLLSAPIDPQTLLDRLNTRRLYARLLYYKREQKRKVEEEAAKALSGEDNNIDVVEGGDEAKPLPEAGVPGMGGPIQKMYRDLLKEKVTADRVWRKNMTIEELANLEWNELLKVAELR